LNVACIILAGGLARRMGGGDKPLRPLAGRPLLDHVVDRLRPQAEVLALNANGDPERFRAWRLPVVPDTIKGNPGPLAGILAGLEWTAQFHPTIDDIVTAPGDSPFLPPDLVDKLHAARRSANAEIAVAASHSRRHWVVGLWPVRFAGPLRRAMLDEHLRKVSSFAGLYRCAIADFAAASIDPFANINDEGELRQAELLSLRRF
jgi:molybdopterin-guanine dinucleotide biosynthesis protein A